VYYPSEVFTEDERAKLANHFTNLEGPVFALINLPETVKGSLRSLLSVSGHAASLFLDEFADGLPDIGDRAALLRETKSDDRLQLVEDHCSVASRLGQRGPEGGARDFVSLAGARIPMCEETRPEETRRRSRALALSIRA